MESCEGSMSPTKKKKYKLVVTNNENIKQPIIREDGLQKIISESMYRSPTNQGTNLNQKKISTFNSKSQSRQNASAFKHFDAPFSP